MKKNIVSLFFLAVMTLTSQLKAQITVDASAEIVTPLVIVTDPSGGGKNLNFGAMSSSAAAGTCVLSTTNTRTATGGVFLQNTSNVSSNASFKISGGAGRTYAITVPTGPVSISGAGAPMTITALTVRPTIEGVDQLTGTFDAAGEAVFKVGGTLNVGANQPAGVYTGSFSVIAAYN
jgi:hypothetical protein